MFAKRRGGLRQAAEPPAAPAAATGSDHVGFSGATDMDIAADLDLDLSNQLLSSPASHAMTGSSLAHPPSTSLNVAHHLTTPQTPAVVPRDLSDLLQQVSDHPDSGASTGTGPASMLGAALASSAAMRTGLTTPALPLHQMDTNMNGMTRGDAMRSSSTAIPPPAMSSKSEARGLLSAQGAEQLRLLVQDCLNKGMHSTAVFLANKLLRMTEGDPDDVYLLARACLLGGEPKRAVMLLRNYGLLDPPQQQNVDGDQGVMSHLTYGLQYRYLGAQCLAAYQEWAECLRLLGEDEDTFLSLVAADRVLPPELQSNPLTAIDIRAGLCLLRGKCFEGLENRARAASWYQRAVQLDAKCYEAFERLIEGRMITSDAARMLVKTLKLPAELQWLQCYYNLADAVSDHQSGDRIITVAQKQLGVRSVCMCDAMEAEQFNLESDVDYQTSLASYHFARSNWAEVDAISKRVVNMDPYHLAILPLRICALVELQQSNELFMLAHFLVENHPKSSVAWLAVGYYYYLVGKLQQAWKHFNKAVQLDRYNAAAWIGFAHCKSLLDESDPAVAAYRTAARLFPGSHVPLVSIGMECLKSSNFSLAKDYFDHALQFAPTDPLVRHELGMLAYRMKEYRAAIGYFKKTLALVGNSPKLPWEATIFNLGHCHRKMGAYVEAEKAYRECLAISPRSASAFSAIGFALHLQNKPIEAIDYYHKALSVSPRDTFATDMLNRAVADVNQASVPPLHLPARRPGRNSELKEAGVAAPASSGTGTPTGSPRTAVNGPSPDLIMPVPDFLNPGSAVPAPAARSRFVIRARGDAPSPNRYTINAPSTSAGGSTAASAGAAGVAAAAGAVAMDTIDSAAAAGGAPRGPESQ